MMTPDRTPAVTDTGKTTGLAEPIISRHRGQSYTASVETATTGNVVPKAKPCATPAPMRSPVNEPGPLTKAIASSSFKLSAFTCSTSSIIGIRRLACCRAWVQIADWISPSRFKATEQWLFDVSIARMIDMAGLYGKEIKNPPEILALRDFYNQRMRTD